MHFLNFLIVNTCLSNPDVTSWRDGGGRALAPTMAGEGVVEGGVGGAMGMEGAAGGPLLPSPLPQPPVGPQFPAYRGIMPPFVSPTEFYHLVLSLGNQWCLIYVFLFNLC